MEVSLRDLTGRIVRRQTQAVGAGRWSGAVELDGLAPGVYVVRVREPDGRVGVRRVVKEG